MISLAFYLMIQNRQQLICWMVRPLKKFCGKKIKISLDKDTLGLFNVSLLGKALKQSKWRNNGGGLFVDVNLMIQSIQWSLMSKVL